MNEETVFFHYENISFRLKEPSYQTWLHEVISSEKLMRGTINIILCSDEYLLEVNKQYLNHDYYTDVITFDYTNEDVLSADIYVSIDRVKDNANEYDTSFEKELQRVLAHGILHCCGYGDKNPEDQQRMRQKEDEKIKMFHVEH